MKKTYRQIKYGTYAEGDTAVTLRSMSGDYGGGQRGADNRNLRARRSRKRQKVRHCLYTPSQRTVWGGEALIVETLVFDEGQITCPTHGGNPTWGGCATRYRGTPEEQ